MGILQYGESTSFDFDDRTLTHLRTVILGKLQLHESFTFTWSDHDQQRSIWVHPGALLQFTFERKETPELNPHWVQQLQALANSPTGLRLVEEPAPH